MITVIKDPYLMVPEHREVSEVPFIPGMTVADAARKPIEDLRTLGFDEFVICRNGDIVFEPDEVLIEDGDFIAVTVNHGFQALVGFIWLFMVNAGLQVAYLTTALAYAIGAAVMIGGGLLINTLMAPAQPGNPKQGDNKPSYGWSGIRNETAPGTPVPVAYGRPYSAPQVIGSYRTVTKDRSMWQYLLLAAGAGKTNHVLTSSDVYIGDELLTAWPDYAFGATDGDITISAATRTALADFDKVHHDRPFDKRLIHSDRSGVSLITLLHCNIPVWTATTAKTAGKYVVPTTLNGYCYECTTPGNTGGTEPASWSTTPGNTTVDGGVTWTCRAYTSAPVIDSNTRGTADWTKSGTAQLKFDTPKFGNAYLSLTGTDYISTPDIESLRMDYPAQVEFWFRLPDLSDRVIWGKQIKESASVGTMQSILSFGYCDGAFFLQSAFGFGATVAAVTDWTATLDMSAADTPSTGTWYYCRIQSYFDPDEDALAYQVLLEDVLGGDLILLDLDYDSTISNPDAVDTDEPLAVIDQDAARQSRYEQQIGMGYHYDAATGLVTQMYGVCDIDEVRVCRGIADDSSDRTLPTGELVGVTAAADPFTIATKSKVDSVRIIIEFSQGLFKTDSSGVIKKKVKFNLDYRETGTSGAWITSVIEPEAKKTAAARFQYELVFPSRAFYDVRIERLSPEDGNSNTKKSVSHLISFEEIINLALYYPGLQVIALGVKASNTRSGQLGAIKIRHNRTSIVVPDWDGVGTQTVDATVPMWQLYDCFTNAHYGAKIDPTTIIQADFEDWRDWTEGTVDGYTRAESNIIFDESGNLADTAIAHIEQVGRSRVVRMGSNWSVVVDRPRTSQYAFSSGNIIKGTFEWSSYEDTEKTDAVEVTYWDASKQGTRSSKIAKASWYETLTRIPKIAQIEIRGIVSAEQALREAIFRINKNEYVTRQGKHRALLAAALVELGDVCTIIPPVSTSVFGGRLRQDHVAASTVYLDQWVTLPAATYSGKLKFIVIDPNGNEQSFDVTGPWDTKTDNLNLETDYSIRSTAYTWIITGSGTAEYRCELPSGGSANLDEPDTLTINGTVATRGTAGSLAAGEWDFAISDGFETVIVRLSDGTDPDTKAAGYITMQRTYTGSRFDPFGCGRVSEDKLLNQIIRKSINPKEKNVDLEWCEYSDSVFYNSGYGSGLVAI